MFQSQNCNTLKTTFKKRLKIYLVKKATRSIWSFKRKSMLKSLLQRPDFSQPFILTTDVSGFAIGCVLS